MRFGLIVFALLILIALPQAGSPGQEPSEATLLTDGLRSRRLFDLAISYCAKRLQDSETDPTERATLTLELIKTYTAKATVTDGPTSEESWQEATEVADIFLTNNPNHPRRMLIAVQKALSHQAHGRVIAQEIAADIAPQSERERALEELRISNSQFSEIEREIDAMLRKTRGRTLNEHELDVEMLTALKNNVRFQSAVGNLNRAQLYPPEDQLNRIDALNQVALRLDEVRRVTTSEQPIWWQVQFHRVECLRLLGDFAEAKQVLAEIPEEADDEQKQRTLEQQILIAIDERSTDTNKFLDQAESLAPRTSQLDLAIVKLLKFNADASNEEAAKNRWLSLAEKQTRVVEANHGPYWGRRAELILIGMNNSNSTLVKPPENMGANDGQVAIMERIGDQALRKNRLVDAVKAYDQAVVAAEAKQDGQAILAIGVKAGKALEKQKLNRVAAERFLKLSMRFSDSKFAPSTHLRGCWNLAQSKTAEDTARFREQLAAHIERWPDAATTDQARIWLGGQLQNAGEFEKAIDLYFTIDQENLLSQALLQSAVCGRNQLKVFENSEASPAQFVKHLVESAIAKFEELRQLNPNKWTDSQRALLLIRAEFGLPFQIESPEPLSELLADSYFEATAPLRDSLAIWTLAAIARVQDSNLDANVWMEKVQSDPKRLQRAATALATIAKQTSNPIPRLEQLRLQLVELGQSSDEQGAIFWTAQKASALQALGRDSEAVEALEQLAKARPNSAAAQFELARTMTRLSGEEAQSKALNQWRRIASQTRPKTEGWFEAKYHVALMLEKTGSRDEALKLLEYLNAIPPGWSQSTWRPKFESLLARCRN